MVRKATRERGRPRKKETGLSRWLDSVGMDRYDLADRLGVGRAYIDKVCRGERRPSLELALEIEKLTKGAVSAGAWLAVPAHSKD